MIKVEIVTENGQKLSFLLENTPKNRDLDSICNDFWGKIKEITIKSCQNGIYWTDFLSWIGNYQ